MLSFEVSFNGSSESLLQDGNGCPNESNWKQTTVRGMFQDGSGDARGDVGEGGGGWNETRSTENGSSSWSSSDGGCERSPLKTDGGLLTVFVYGYLTPPLVLITLVTNCLVCIVLLKRSTRSPTNTLLVAMAVSDTLTGLWPIPFFLSFYTGVGGAHRSGDWVPYDWCFAYLSLTDYLPTVFHTASIWLTVALAVQRYVYVRHPHTAKRLCTISNAIKVVAAIYVLSIASQLSRFVEVTFDRVELDSEVVRGLVIVGCCDRFSPFVERHTEVYFNVYYWFRVVFIHLVPCASLVVLNAILVSAMSAAKRRRHLLLRQNRRMESRRLQESNATTMMLVTVVGLFLLVEFPLAIFLIALICNNNSETSIMSSETVDVISLVINLFILLSYPLNFFVYCGMSRQFRETFKALFVRGPTAKKPIGGPNGGGLSQYVSLATESVYAAATVAAAAPATTIDVIGPTPVVANGTGTDSNGETVL